MEASRLRLDTAAVFVRGIPVFVRDRATRRAVLGGLIAVACVPLAALAKAASVPAPPHAYHFRAWIWWDRGWLGRMRAAKLSYPRHVACRLHLAGQLLVAGTVGYVHAFFAGLVPFVAEECGAELFALVTARRLRGGQPDHAAEGTPYAYTPSRWIYAIDGRAHVSFSGGTWGNHARFACWASGQFLIGALCGFIHAFVPPLFPTVAEEVGLDLGGLIVNRRKLRNTQEKFVNPDNLSDFLNKDWQAKFKAAEAAAAAALEVGDQGAGLSELAAAKIKVKLGPGAKAEFL